MSLFQINIQSVLTSMLRTYARDPNEPNPKYVNTAMFYFQQLESLDVLSNEQKKQWAEALSDALLSTKESGFNQNSIRALDTYLDVISKKIARSLPYYQSYCKAVIGLNTICEIRHNLGISNVIYEKYKAVFKSSVNPSDKEIKEMVELESFIENRTAQTRELGNYITLSRDFGKLLRKTSGILMRLRKDYRPYEYLSNLFNTDFYNNLYFVPSGQLDVMRQYYDDFISINSLLERVEKNLENKNAQAQLMDAVAGLRRYSSMIEEHISTLKKANNSIGFGDYHSNEGRVIRMNEVIGFKRAA